MQEPIRECPHCGGLTSLRSNYSPQYRKYFVFCKCEICGAQGKAYTQPDPPSECDWNSVACEDAVGAWNMRYNPLPAVTGGNRTKSED